MIHSFWCLIHGLHERNQSELQGYHPLVCRTRTDGDCFSAWCTVRNKDPPCCSVGVVLDFLVSVLPQPWRYMRTLFQHCKPWSVMRYSELSATLWRSSNSKISLQCYQQTHKIVLFNIQSTLQMIYGLTDKCVNHVFFPNSVVWKAHWNFETVTMVFKIQYILK